MERPAVSVVMSVYNGADGLEATLSSVLQQQDCEFEFIVIDDGSTDGSGEMLDDWARNDRRLAIVHQANSGLTRALIRGCELARGEFIARQDCGDRSLPGRLAAQVARLRGHPVCAAVTCHTAFVGPQREPLYVTAIPEETLNGALSGSAGPLIGPSHHGSVMMRADAYRSAGGYRAAFHFAQDLDLWTRLVEQGRFAVVAATLYEAQILPASISGTQSAEQRGLAELIEQLAAVRRAGGDESALLQEAARVRRAPGGPAQERIAQGHYFIASCLRRSAPERADAYFREVLRHDPWHWRARMRLIQSKVGMR